MASLYRISYRTTTDSISSADVTATTEDNAWAAVQTNDPLALSLESIDEVNANIWIGS